MSKTSWIVMIVVGSFLFLIFVNKPNNEQKNVERSVQLEQNYINQRVENNKNDLLNCLDSVDQRIKNDVQAWCKTASQMKPSFPNEKFIDLAPNCSFPEKLLEPFVQGWEKQKKEGKEECYKLYPQ